MAVFNHPSSGVSNADIGGQRLFRRLPACNADLLGSLTGLMHGWYF